jgi:uncharacterized metal-binding protein YceD (DUF177 family)
MEPLIAYSIPIQGLLDGTHQFDYQIDRSFFENFEDSPIADGQIHLQLSFDKRPDLYVLWFEFEGTVKTECDRCLAAIDLPISGKQRLLVKLRETDTASDDPEIIFISPEAQKLNVAPFAYEFICLAMPLIKVYDCENDEQSNCDEEMLAKLDQNSGFEPEEEEEPEENPIWAELKKLNKNN